MNLPPDLGLAEVTAFVMGKHAEYTRRYFVNGIEMAPPMRVSQFAKRLAEKFYAGRFGADKNISISAAQFGGQLIYCFDRYGCSFEELCDVIGYDLTMLLSSISPDARLPRAQRYIDIRGRVAHAVADAQIIKLAEMLVLQHTFRDMLDGLESHLDGVENRREWFDVGMDCLELAKYLCTCMGALRADKNMAQSLNNHRMKFKEIIDLWEAAKARFV